MRCPEDARLRDLVRRAITVRVARCVIDLRLSVERRLRQSAQIFFSSRVVVDVSSLNWEPKSVSRSFPCLSNFCDGCRVAG